MQMFLLQVNTIATEAQADAKKGKYVKFDMDVLRCLLKEAIYDVAFPPLKRKKAGLTRSDVPVENRTSEVREPPPQLSILEFTTNESIVISCDGSFSRQDCESGWGFTVAGLQICNLLDFCGPSIIDNASHLFIGAAVHSNNVGELLAIIYGLMWFSERCPCDKCILEYDSEYAALSAQRLWRGRENLRLILHARSAYDRVAGRVTWRKVEAHAGHFLNERADLLAKLGANGTYSGLADIQRWTITLKR